MNCRYCQKDIDTELVEHILMSHPTILLFYLFKNISQEDKFKVLNDVFPDFNRIMNS